MPLHETPLRYRAHGKWAGIFAALGVPEKLLNTRKHQPCPFCGGKDRFRFTDKDDDGWFYCNQCKAIGAIDFLIKLNGWNFAKAAKEVEAVMGDIPIRPAKSKDDPDAREAMQKLWDRCSLIVPGDFVDSYLASRGVNQEGYSRWLRKSESVKHETEDGRQSWHPAMVAKILAPDGTPANLHRTYLTLDGHKAEVEPQRKTMRGTIPPGSAIRLFDPGPVLGIAEGIETAFAAAELFRIPVWSAINSTILAKWEPPAETHQVIIFGDNDPKFGGQAAALALAHRLSCKGVSARPEIPTDAKDWNDVLKRKRGIAPAVPEAVAGIAAIATIDRSRPRFPDNFGKNGGQ